MESESSIIAYKVKIILKIYNIKQVIKLVGLRMICSIFHYSFCSKFFIILVFSLLVKKKTEAKLPTAKSWKYFSSNVQMIFNSAKYNLKYRKKKSISCLTDDFKTFTSVFSLTNIFVKREKVSLFCTVTVNRTYHA